MTLHTLEPTQEHLVGCFSRGHSPILTIDPGETVRYRTLDAGWGLEPLVTFEIPRKKLEPRHGESDSGHCLVGPIAIRGAVPGMTLAVEIGTIIRRAFPRTTSIVASATGVPTADGGASATDVGAALAASDTAMNVGAAGPSRPAR